MESHKVLRGVLYVAFSIAFFQITTWGARQIFGEGVLCNAGAVFGSSFPTPFILFLSGTLIIFFVREWLREKDRVIQWILMLIIASGLSNLLERIFFGCVYDYLKLPFIPHFNLADLFLTLSVILFLWYMIREKNAKKDS